MSTNSTEETTSTPNDTAIFFRVNYKCKNDESLKEILSFLQLMVKYQLDYPHPGVILYHFTHPDPENEPYLLQFTELYKDATVFFAHSKNDELVEAYKKTFIPPEKNRESSDFYAYGVPVTNDQMVKVTCEFLHGKYPETVAGFLINTDAANIIAAGTADPVLATFEFSVKTGDLGAINNNLVSIANCYVNKALLFHAANVYSEDEVHKYEVTALFANNNHLIAHFNAWKHWLVGIYKMASNYSCRLYGEVAESSKAEIENHGFPILYRSTDVGYVLHPLVAKAFEG